MPSSRASSWSGCGRGRGGRSKTRMYSPGRSQPYQYRRTSSVTPSQVSSRHARPAPSVRFVPSDAASDVVRDDDFLEQVILAIDVKDKGRVGCAYYIAGEERLLCMEEVIGGGTEVVEKCESPPHLPFILNIASEIRSAADDYYSVSSLRCIGRQPDRSPSKECLAGGQW